MGSRTPKQLTDQVRAGSYHKLSAYLASSVPIDRAEFTNPLAAGAALLRAATATVTTASQVLKAALLAGGLAELAKHPRRVTITTAGATPADAPATALITGKDIDGKVQTETVNVPQTATLVSTTGFFADITSIDFPAGEGTAATLAIGFGAAIGLPAKPKLVNGAVAAIAEWTDGAPSGTRGTYIAPASGAPHGGVTFNTAPDGAHDYAVWFERDA